MLAKFHQAHGLFQTQPLDAFANPLFLNKTLSGFRIDLRFMCFLSLDYRRITHLLRSSCFPPTSDKMPHSPICCPHQICFLSRKIISHIAGIQLEGEKNKIDSVNNPAVGPTILLSGASGMLGSALRQALAGRNVSILQLVRREPRSAGELRWDPFTRKPVADVRALEGLAAAIHLAGANIAAHRWTDAYKREMVKSRVESTYALASVLSSLRQPPVAFVAASATGFYG